MGESIRLDTYHLLGHHDDRLDGELSVAVVEEVLQTGSEKVNDENVVETLLAKVIDIRDPGCTRLVLVLNAEASNRQNNDMRLTATTRRRSRRQSSDGIDDAVECKQRRQVWVTGHVFPLQRHVLGDTAMDQQAVKG